MAQKTIKLPEIKLPEFPPRGSGLEQLGKLFKSAYNSYTLAGKKPGDIKYKPLITRYIRKEGTTEGRPLLKDPLETLKNSVQSLSKSLSGALEQIVKKPEVVDYSAVARSFMPEGARLLKPKLPGNVQEVLQADLDGDGRNELVATYKTREGLRTFILKGQGNKWQKTAEIYHPEHDDIHYRHAISLTGENRQHLLIGMSGGGSGNMLYGYSLADNMATRLFHRGYSWVEPVRMSRNAGRQPGMLSVWNKAEDGLYDIEVLNWTGNKLESAADDTFYYRTRVVPYYLMKAKQNRSDLNYYYRLAESLMKAGAWRDARVVAEAGSRQVQDQRMKEKFIAMKNEIMAKYM